MVYFEWYFLCVTRGMASKFGIEVSEKGKKTESETESEESVSDSRHAFITFYVYCM